MTVGDELILTAGTPERRMLMPRVGRDAFARRDLYDRRPHRHEQLRVIALAKLVVDIG